MLIDWSTSNILQVLQIFVIIAGGFAVFARMRSDIRVMRTELSYVEKGMATLNEAFAQLGSILTQVAVQDNRLNMLEKHIDEMRHGEGFMTEVKNA